MRSVQLHIVVLVVLCFLGHPRVFLAQSAGDRPRFALTVTVQQTASGAIVAGARVWVPDLGVEMVSDSTGRAVFGDLPAASYRIVVRTLGYAPLDTTIRLTSAMTVILRIAATAVQLEAVGVSSAATQAHLREFEFRRQTRTGRYLVESDLVAEGDRQFAGVAATRFPGLKKVWDADGQVHLASTRGPCGYQEAELSRRRGLSSCLTSKPCLVRMYLDGMRLSEDDFGLIKTQHLAAIEYYTGATVPAQYRIAGAACGVMLVWTKR